MGDTIPLYTPLHMDGGYDTTDEQDWLPYSQGNDIAVMIEVLTRLTIENCFFFSSSMALCTAYYYDVVGNSRLCL
jgi:hypothetical protein